MAQVTIYLDDQTEERMDRAARDAGLSRSRWVANLIREKTRTEWPDSFRRLIGQGQDFPEVAEIRKGLGDDFPRQSL